VSRRGEGGRGVDVWNGGVMGSQRMKLRHNLQISNFESARITEGGNRMFVVGFASSGFPFFSRGLLSARRNCWSLVDLCWCLKKEEEGDYS
jgi:hypothetical protein